MALVVERRGARTIVQVLITTGDFDPVVEFSRQFDIGLEAVVVAIGADLAFLSLLEYGEERGVAKVSTRVGPADVEIDFQGQSDPHAEMDRMGEMIPLDSLGEVTREHVYKVGSNLSAMAIGS